MQKNISFEEKNILEDEAAGKELTEKYHSQKTPVLVIEKVVLDAAPDVLKQIF